MMDWKEWFEDISIISKTDICTITTGAEEDRYQAYKSRLIEEGYIVDNPVRWVRPTRNEIFMLFNEKLPLKIQEHRVRDMSTDFYDYWDGLDWFRGKTRMKSYKGSISTWIGNNYDKNTGSNSQGDRKLSVSEQVAAGIKSRENENTTNTEESGQIVADYG